MNTFNRVALLDALRVASRLNGWRRVVPQKDRIPVTRPAVAEIAISAGVASILVANLDMRLSVRVACDGPDATFYAPTSVLTAAVEKALGDAVSFRPAGETVTMTAGRLRSTFGASPEDIPGATVAVDAARHPIRCVDLRAGLGATEPATIADKSRPFLGGVCVHDTPAGLAFVGMDGNRIHSAAMDGNRIEARAIFPDSLVSLLLNTLPTDGVAEIRIGKRAAVIEFGDVTIVSGLIDGTFPSYQQQLHAPTDRVLRGCADQILSDLELVAIVSSARDRDIRLDLGTISEASAFRRDRRGVDSGAVQMLAAFEGAPLAIGFQMHLVRDALKMFGSSKVEWRMSTPTSPTFVTSPDHPGLVAMVLPFLLNSATQKEAA